MVSPPPARFDSRRHWIWAIAVLLAVTMLAAWLAGSVAERRAADAARQAMYSDARLRAALLGSEVARYRLLPLALAGDMDVNAALQPGASAARQRLNLKLEPLARQTGAAAIYVLDRSADTVAASNWRTPNSFVGDNYRFRRYFSNAGGGRAAVQFALGARSGQSGLYLSRGTRQGGVIVVKLEFDAIERQWAAAAGQTIVTDRNGVILIASDPALRFAATRPIPRERAGAIRRELRLPTPLGNWSPSPAALTVDVAAPLYDWTLSLVRPGGAITGSAVWTARLVAAGLVLMLGGAAALLALRGERQARGRALQRARTIELEAAVAERTAALRREIEERQATEAHAATLREGLRQANRLATLGQVTASVAHETAQPVAAIRTYAAAGLRLIDSADRAVLRGNLEAIDRLAERIGSVTAELRGFARKGSKPIGPVPVADLIGGARLILKERLRGIALNVGPIPAGLNVLAGRVRVEQILVNLIQNAVEALDGVEAPAIQVTIDAAADLVAIRIADNGPGIAAEVADRLFTPFSTSRVDGLGLGLVIAQDIAEDMGGTLCLLPSVRGALFELRLRRAA